MIWFLVGVFVGAAVVGGLGAFALYRFLKGFIW